MIRLIRLLVVESFLARLDGIESHDPFLPPEATRFPQVSYSTGSSWQNLATEEKHALHDEYPDAGAFPGVIAHYRLRPPQMTTTVRVQEEQIVKTAGPLADTRENFRAFYLLESDDLDSVLELAARIPAARTGGAVEVWPLTER